MSDSVWPHRQHPPGSAIHGILQARTLEWVAISFSSAWNFFWRNNPCGSWWAPTFLQGIFSDCGWLCWHSVPVGPAPPNPWTMRLEEFCQVKTLHSLLHFTGGQHWNLTGEFLQISSGMSFSLISFISYLLVHSIDSVYMSTPISLLLLLLSRFSHVWLCATP